MDREAQYFLAEATKSLNLNDPSRYEAEHDALWAGCSSSVRTGKLCEVSEFRLPPSKAMSWLLNECLRRGPLRFPLRRSPPTPSLLSMI